VRPSPAPASTPAVTIQPAEPLAHDALAPAQVETFQPAKSEESFVQHGAVFGTHDESEAASASSAPTDGKAEQAPARAASDHVSHVEAEAAPAEAEHVETITTVESQSPLKALLTETLERSAWTHVFAESDKPLTPGKHYNYAFEQAEGIVCLRLSDGKPGATSGGTTHGYNFRLPDALELAASGNPILIKIIARSAVPTASRFACSYSTNEVGNSGFQWRAVGQEWAAYTFPYKVPTMIKGNGDFLGLLPAPEGEPAVDIARIEIQVQAS
jgi:hypothetical protein